MNAHSSNAWYTVTRMTVHEPSTWTLNLPITLRTARAADIPKLEWYGQYAHFRHMLRRAYRDQLNERRVILVADCRSFPVGCIFIQLHSSNQHVADGSTRAYLYSFRVMELFQNNGIGTRLLNAAEDTLCQRKFRWATIAVAKDNRRALHLYERLDYRVFAEDAGQWSYTDQNGQTRYVHEPSWVLEKALPVG